MLTIITLLFTILLCAYIVELHLLAIRVEKFEKENSSSLLFITDFTTRKWWRRFWRFLFKPRHCIALGDIKGFLKWYNRQSRNKRLDIIIHTDGGSTWKANKMVNCLLLHQGPINVYVPWYASSAGAKLTMTGTRIHMNVFSSLTPCDPQHLIFDKEVDRLSNHNINKIKLDESEDIESQATQLLSQQIQHDCILLFKRILNIRHGNLDTRQKSILLNDFMSGKKFHHDKLFNLQFLENKGLEIYPVPRNIQQIFQNSLCNFAGLGIKTCYT